MILIKQVTLSVPLAALVHCTLDLLPREEIAGISVVDSPIVEDALEYARKHNDLTLFNHVTRAWIFGTHIITSNSRYSNVDPEVHAVATILSALGLDLKNGVVSKDRRFEVDGAFAARDFIRNHTERRKWDERRIQQVWDAIVLSTEHAIARYKEPVVWAVTLGIEADMMPEQIPKDIVRNVLELYPLENLYDGIRDKMIEVCKVKPVSTYDTWMEALGNKYVSGYSAKGYRMIDRIDAGG